MYSMLRTNIYMVKWIWGITSQVGSFSTAGQPADEVEERKYLQIKTLSLRTKETTLLSGEDTKFTREMCSVQVELLNSSLLSLLETRDLENFH